MLSIVICTYNRPRLFQNCLAGALQALDKIESEIIVINDSKTSAVEVPQHPRIRLFNNPKQGIASARNLGAEKALGELILFIDDDIEFTFKNIEDLLTVYAQKEPACYNPNWRYSDEMYNTIRQTRFGRFLIHYKLVDYKGWVPDLNWQSGVFNVKQLAGFFMLVPKPFFKTAGGFNEGFTNQGTEDDELCWRLGKAGVKMYVASENYVFHNEMDRVTLEARTQRFYHGAMNRRKAFELGNKDYGIHYSAVKKIILKLVLPFEPLLRLSAKIIPNKPAFDFLYFKIANVLIATAIYRGYSQSS